VDPFTQLAESKKKRVAVNKKSQLQNAKAADQQGQLPATLKLAAVLGGGSTSNSKSSGPRALPKTKRKELKDEVHVLMFGEVVRGWRACACVCACECKCVTVCVRV
jgi:hypothetical protein